jgi:hypothetical protein
VTRLTSTTVTGRLESRITGAKEAYRGRIAVGTTSKSKQGRISPQTTATSQMIQFAGARPPTRYMR